MKMEHDTRDRAGLDRVPIGRPSIAVNPIVLDRLRPAEMAHIEAPLPRCATIDPALGDIRGDLAQGAERCTHMKARGIRSAATPSA